MSPCVCVCARDYVGVFAKAYLRVGWYMRACVIALYVRSRYIYMYILHLCFVAKFRRKQNS